MMIPLVVQCSFDADIWLYSRKLPLFSLLFCCPLIKWLKFFFLLSASFEYGIEIPIDCMEIMFCISEVGPIDNAEISIV